MGRTTGWMGGQWTTTGTGRTRRDGQTIYIHIYIYIYSSNILNTTLGPNFWCQSISTTGGRFWTRVAESRWIATSTHHVPSFQLGLHSKRAIEKEKFRFAADVGLCIICTNMYIYIYIYDSVVEFYCSMFRLGGLYC